MKEIKIKAGLEVPKALRAHRFVYESDVSLILISVHRPRTISVFQIRKRGYSKLSIKRIKKDDSASLDWIEETMMKIRHNCTMMQWMDE